MTSTLFTAVFLAAVGVIAGETCLAYYDNNGDWHESFECDSLIFDRGTYCCGTLTDKYCCIDEDDRIKEEDQLSAAIIGVIVGVVVLVVIIGLIICICVCCCNACAECCRTRTTTTYVHSNANTSPTVVVASTQQSSITPGVAYTPTVASNPMYAVGPHPPPPYPGQK